MEALCGEEPRVRQGATRALSCMAAEDSGALSHLIEALSDKESCVREGAATALGHATSRVETVVSALEELLERDRENEKVRKAAAASLERVKKRYRQATF